MSKNTIAMCDQCQGAEGIDTIESLPNGWITLQVRDKEEFQEFHLCSWECAAAHAAEVIEFEKTPPLKRFAKVLNKLTGSPSGLKVLESTGSEDEASKQT